MHDPFDSDGILADAKEDHVIAHSGQPCIYADLGPQPINLRLFGYFLHPRAKQTKHARCMAWAVLGDIIRDLLKVVGH